MLTTGFWSKDRYWIYMCTKSWDYQANGSFKPVAVQTVLLESQGHKTKGKNIGKGPVEFEDKGIGRRYK